VPSSIQLQLIVNTIEAHLRRVVFSRSAIRECWVEYKCFNIGLNSIIISTSLKLFQQNVFTIYFTSYCAQLTSVSYTTSNNVHVYIMYPMILVIYQQKNMHYFV
jgi:hypothetical protein